MPFYPSSAGQVQVQDGSVWRELGIATGIRWTPAEGTTTTVDTINYGQLTNTALPGDGNLAIDLIPNDAIRPFDLITAAARAGSQITIRNDAEKAVSVLKQGASQNMLDIADTSGVTGSGTLTATGTSRENFGSEAAPNTPWNQGLVIVIGTVAYVIERFLTATTAEIWRFGAVTSKVAAKDASATAPGTVAATTAWKLVQPIMRRQYVGVPQVPPGIDTATGSRTSTITLALAAAPTLSMVVEV